MYRGYEGSRGIMQNLMESKMDNVMETWIMWWFVGCLLM